MENKKICTLKDPATCPYQCLGEQKEQTRKWPENFAYEEHIKQKEMVDTTGRAWKNISSHELFPLYETDKGMAAIYQVNEKEAIKFLGTDTPIFRYELPDSNGKMIPVIGRLVYFKENKVPEGTYIPEDGDNSCIIAEDSKGNRYSVFYGDHTFIKYCPGNDEGDYHLEPVW